MIPWMTCNDGLNLLSDWNPLRTSHRLSIVSYPLPWLTLSVPTDLPFDKLNIKIRSTWMFPKIGGKTPKMDGENNGKPY